MPSYFLDGRNKTIVITGASSGIGREIALALAQTGATVILICRNKEKGTATAVEIIQATTNPRVYPYNADLQNQKEIKYTAHRISTDFPVIDVLIHNAACVNSNWELTDDGIEKQFAVNHLAPFYLSHWLLPALKKSTGSRIICLNSRAHARGTMHFNDLFLQKSYNISKAYNQSKLANMLFTYALAEKMIDKHVTVNAFHPGLVNTRFGEKGVSFWHKWVWIALSKLGRPAHRAAKDAVYLALSADVKDVTGKYFHNYKPIKSSAQSYNKQWAQKLWQISLELTKLNETEYGQLC